MVNGSASAPPQRDVLVGVCGGIAIYKAVEVVRTLAKEGFNTTVVETPAARRFVLPLTFAAVADSRVVDEDTAWSSTGRWFEHVEAARRADVMVIAPATGNTVGKFAAGIADNLLTSVYLAFRGPVIIAPAMNWAMYQHPATQRNLEILAARGHTVLPTGRGPLACGEEGSGRMAEPGAIVAAVKRAFAGLGGGALSGRRVVVSAGGTREAIDAVRFLGNRSSGRMGIAVADAAYLAGAEVTLISTVDVADTPYEVHMVESAEEMAAAVGAAVDGAHVLVMAAAVADYKPAVYHDGKIERGLQDRLTLDLERTVDVLDAAARPGLLRVAFAAEAGPRLDRARAKRAAKQVELLVFNDILQEGVGIGSDENEITIIGPEGEQHVPRSSKAACAEAIVAAIARQLALSDGTDGEQV